MSPSVRKSVTPPERVATTGTPVACASRTLEAEGLGHRGVHEDVERPQHLGDVVHAADEPDPVTEQPTGVRLQALEVGARHRTRGPDHHQVGAALRVRSGPGRPG